MINARHFTYKLRSYNDLLGCDENPVVVLVIIFVDKAFVGVIVGFLHELLITAHTRNQSVLHLFTKLFQHKLKRRFFGGICLRNTAAILTAVCPFLLH